MKQLVFGHRGASGYAPENTLEAFELAIRQGADGVELDVHLTRDAQLVVAHDEEIDRVADGSGLICDMTLAELKKYHFNRTQPLYKTATIPTLQEVFELIAPSNLTINIELKNSVIDYPGLERSVIELAARMGMEKRVLYSSFNHYSLLRIKEMDPTLPCGMLYEATMIEPWNYAARYHMDAIHPHFSELFVPGEAAAAHKLGIKINTWTVNKPEHMKRVFDAGADILITNYPDIAMRVRAQLPVSV